jgi:NADH:ubiquinone oxidoreductase subunit F (NADH-binding)
VFEIPLGARLSDVVQMAGSDADDVAGVLVGGYFGSWFPAGRLADIRMSVGSLQKAGGGLGAGIVFVMPRRDTCALAEITRATRWLADQNAGQCGPCVNGLDAIARAMAVVVAGDRDRRAETQIKRWLSMMEGRGACKHPDGVARFVASGLAVFADEIERHRRLGPCRTAATALLPTPKTGGWR